jgi:hypothetical protein
MKIIGLGHRKFVGKDTCFKYMQMAYKDLNNDVLLHARRVSFADILKDVCRVMYPTQIRENYHYEHNTEAKNDPVKLYDGNITTVRGVWIKVGNVLRSFDPNIWIGAAFAAASNQSQECIIVTDVRYPNEAEYIRDLGGLLFRVDNPRIAHTNDEADAALQGYQGWDDVINNQGSLKELEEKCKNLVQRHSNYLKE